MHHFVTININIDQAEGVAQLLDLQGVVCNRHIPLFNVIQLLMELKFTCGCVGREDLIEIPPSFLQCFGVSDIAEHVIMNA